MHIDSDLAAFLTSPVMIILGTCNAHGSPDIGRGVGARVDSSGATVDVVVSGWQWPGTVANVRNSGRAAVTFARPSDYVTYQVKGRAHIVEYDAVASAICSRYIPKITDVLCGLGLEQRLIADWLTDREAVLIRLGLETAFVQTPGPKAGSPIAAHGC